jgi:DNA-binding MarR family transcriptional regulator
VSRTVARFDEIIHPSTRLSIVALLAAVDWAEFAFVRDHLELSDSALSKQLTTLEDAGYVTMQRTVSSGRQRVRIQLTPRGRTALQGHAAALRTLLDDGVPERR